MGLGKEKGMKDEKKEVEINKQKNNQLWSSVQWRV